jgi:hypothetical protein
MVARLIRNETPDRYRVETGLIRNTDPHDPRNSRQIDLLVHDPSNAPPLYRWEDFVVVPDRTARAVVEVKSNLDRRGFNELLSIHESVRTVNSGVPGRIPTFGYALTGVGFATFTDYLAETIKENRIARIDPRFTAADANQNLPTCIVVQEENYIAVTPSDTRAGEWFCGAIKYPRSQFPDGTETGVFIDLYSGLIQPGDGSTLNLYHLSGWFNRQQVPVECKVYIDQHGGIRNGDMPLPP